MTAQTSSNHSETTFMFSKMTLTLSRLLYNFSYIANVLCRVDRFVVWIVAIARQNDFKNLSKNSVSFHFLSERANSRNSSFIKTHESIASRRYTARLIILHVLLHLVSLSHTAFMSLRSLTLQNSQKSRVRLWDQLMTTEIFRNFLIVNLKSWSLRLIEISSFVALHWALRMHLRGFIEGEKEARNTCNEAALKRAKRSASDISVTLMFFKNAWTARLKTCARHSMWFSSQFQSMKCDSYRRSESSSQIISLLSALFVVMQNNFSQISYLKRTSCMCFARLISLWLQSTFVKSRRSSWSTKFSSI